MYTEITCSPPTESTLGSGVEGERNAGKGEIDLMNEGIEMAKEKKDVNSIRGFVNDGFEIHGMKDKETITTTDRLEAVQTRKLIDNINQEEEKLIATRKVEEPAGDR